MWTKATIGGLAALALVTGGAGAAIAHAQSTSGTPAAATATPTGTATTGAAATGKAAAKPAKAGQNGDVAKQILGKLSDLQHAEWVTKGDGNTFVTHDAIQGEVTAVSSSSITVKAADGTSLTFAVNDQTKVHAADAAKAAKTGKKGAAGATGTATTSPSAPATPTIADVKTGQTVVVGGEKSPDLTAKHILARAG